jgi:hypothetical protein
MKSRLVELGFRSNFPKEEFLFGSDSAPVKLRFLSAKVFLQTIDITKV